MFKTLLQKSYQKFQAS